MPLITFCGFPSSGKTTLAQKLAEHIRQTQPQANVQLINEESIQVDKNEGYKNSHSEKITRASLKAAVDRVLNKDTFVILDSLNYIKGFRYELYCLARSVKTPHCVVWVSTDSNTVFRWNSTQGEGALSPALCTELISRFEQPIEKNRWDCPLFVVDMATLEQQTAENLTHSEEKKQQEGEEKVSPFVEQKYTLLCQDIMQRLLSTGVVNQSTATLTNVHAEPNTLYEVDRITQQTLDEIMKLQQSGIGASGGVLRLSDCSFPLQLVSHVGIAELRRLRRQFMKWISQHPPTSTESIKEAFVQYLNSNLSN